MSLMSEEDPLHGTTCILSDRLPAYKPGQDIVISLEGMGALARLTGLPIFYIDNAIDESTKKEVGFSKYALRYDGVWIIAFDKPIKKEQTQERAEGE